MAARQPPATDTLKPPTHAGEDSSAELFGWHLPPPSPGVFLTVVQQRDGRTVRKHPRQLSPPPASPSGFWQPFCNLHAAGLLGKGPQASSKILALSCFPTESSTHKQKEAWRGARQAEPQDRDTGGTRVGAGVPPAAEASTAAALGMSAPAASGLQTPIQSNISPLPAAKPNTNNMYVLCY